LFAIIKSRIGSFAIHDVVAVHILNEWSLPCAYFLI